MKTKLDDEQMCIVGMVSWCIWNNRNDVIHGKVISNPLVGISNCLLYFNEFQNARAIIGNSFFTQHANLVKKWCKPPVNMVKVNSDASIKGNGFIEIGFVVRDNKGIILGAGVDIFSENFDVKCAKALAIRSSLLFSKECSFKVIMVENDNLSIVDRINKKTVDSSYIFSIIQNCHRLASCFESVVFSHVYREGNKVVHGLTELAKIFSFKVPTFWFDDVHVSILPLVNSDILEE